MIYLQLECNVVSSIINCETYYNDLEHVFYIHMRWLRCQFNGVTGDKYICFHFSVYLSTFYLHFSGFGTFIFSRVTITQVQSKCTC